MGPVGLALLGGAIGTGAGMVTGGVQSAIDWSYAKKAAKLQYKLTRSMNRHAAKDAVRGLRKAGLNPILAAGAVPNQHGPSVVPPKTDIDAVGAVNSAMSAYKTAKLTPAEKDLLDAQESMTQANASKADSDARKADADASIAELTLYDQQEALRARSASDRASATFQSGAGTARAQAETDAARALVPLRGAETRLLRQRGITEQTVQNLNRATGGLRDAEALVEDARARLTEVSIRGATADAVRTEAENVQRDLIADFYDEGGLGDKLRKAGLVTEEINTIVTNLLNVSGLVSKKGRPSSTSETTEYYDSRGKPKGASRRTTKKY